jgi:hypothetical protein
MAHHLSRHTACDGAWDADGLSQAIAERDLFLERHPQLRQLQQEIDRMLDKAGTHQNRMAVLALLMESKLMELHSHLQGLNRILLSVQNR